MDIFDTSIAPGYKLAGEAKKTTPTAPNKKTEDRKALVERMTKSFMAMGLSEAAAKIAATNDRSISEALNWSWKG